jgi:hypothetical protein
MFKALLSIMLCSACAISVIAYPLQEVGDESEGKPVVGPKPVEEIVYARSFALSKGYRWSSVADEPEADTGMIVVLRVDPKLVIPRNAPSPILYAGDRMLQTLNFGHTSGYVIGLIPGEVSLSKTMIWFGPPAAPDRVTQKSIQGERAKAEEAGIRPFSAEQIEKVTKPAVEATNLRALLRGELADLVLEYAPDEGYLARKWRLPEAKAEPDPWQAETIKSKQK